MRPTWEAPLRGTGPLQPCAGRVGSGRCFPQRLGPEKRGSYGSGGGGSPRKFLDCFHLGGEWVWVIEDTYLNWRRLDGMVGE